MTEFFLISLEKIMIDFLNLDAPNKKVREFNFFFFSHFKIIALLFIIHFFFFYKFKTLRPLLVAMLGLIVKVGLFKKYTVHG